MAQRLRGRTTSAVAAAAAAACLAMAAGPALADTVRGQEWWLNSVHVSQAWLSTRGQGVTVALLDTGVDPAQPDLTGSVTTGPDFTGSGRTAGGQFWGAHGTAMASLIAGHGHGPANGDGIMGIAPQARILSIRVTLDPNDPLLKNPDTVAALPRAIARGINTAVRQGAQVIDLPLDPATLAGGSAAGTTGGGPAERAAVAAALRRGVVLVAPAGDDGNGPDGVNYPAAYPGVISVGAFNAGFTRAAYSSRQPYVTLTAPGDGVITASGPTGYAKLASTSAAGAVVAGVAALVRAQFPALSPAQVKQALTSGTAFHPPAGQRDGSGAGTVDAAAALIAAAKIYTASAGGATASPVTPTPPAAPKVRAHTTSLWDAVRYPVLGIAAILVIAVIALIVVRTRQRRERDAQLAPLRAAAQAGQAGQPGADGPDGLVPAAAGGRRAAPFDDPKFVPPSFQNPAPRSPAMTGPVLPNPVFGEPGPGSAAFNRPAPGRPAAGDRVFGTAAADLPRATPAGAALAGDPFGPPAAAPAPFGTAAADAGGAEPGAGTGWPQRTPFGEPPGAPLRSPGPAQRLNAVRAPRTTGHPPWGPAEKPKGELPWMDAPARKPAPGRIAPPRGLVPPGEGPAGAAGQESDAAGQGTGAAGPPLRPPSAPARPQSSSPQSSLPQSSSPQSSLPQSSSPQSSLPQSGSPQSGPPQSGLPQRTAAGRSPFPSLETPPGGTGAPSSDLFGAAAAEPGPRRDYTWNPADTTVNMPAVRLDEPEPGQDY